MTEPAAVGSDRMSDMSPRIAAADESTSGTLARGLTILEFVADQGRVGVAEIAGELGISRSAAYRLVTQLRDRGFLSEPPDGGGVRLGGAAVRLGLQALGGVDLFDLAAGRLATLVDRVRETAFLATFDSGEVVYVLQEVGPNAVTMTAKPGSRRPAHGTALGKAYLAALPAHEREAAIADLDLQPVTPSTITSLEALRRELDATAERGYAIDDGELEPEVRCLAAAVCDHRGTPIASISVGGPVDRILKKEEGIVAAVLDTVVALGRDLGST